MWLGLGRYLRVSVGISIGRYLFYIVSAPIPVVHLPVLTVNTVACMPIVSSL